MVVARLPKNCMADIDADALARYRRDGFIVVQGLLDDVTRQRMKQVLAELIERARGVSQHDDTFDLEPSHSVQRPRVRRIKKPHVVHPVFAEFMRSPRLLAVLSALLGPSGVRLHGSKLNLKGSEIGSPVEWHQDWAFYPHTNDDILAVGVLLDAATPENGPLRARSGISCAFGRRIRRCNARRQACRVALPHKRFATTQGARSRRAKCASYF